MAVETFTLTIAKPIELMDLIMKIRELQEYQGLPDDMLTFVYGADIKWSLKGDDEYASNATIQ